MRPYDLRNATLNDFVTYIFDRPPSSGREKPWLRAIGANEIEFEWNRLAELYKELFSNSCSLMKFSEEQLERGFWDVQSAAYPASVNCVIWERTIPLDVRKDVIASVYFLYRDLFSIRPLETASYMLWDSLRTGPRLNRNDEQEIHELHASMFATCISILALPSEDAQNAALHGMNHLDHPDKRAVIEAYIRDHPDLNQDDIQFCRSCIDGTVL